MPILFLFQESEDAVKVLAKEKDLLEREKWELRRQAKEATDHASALRSQLDLKENRIKELEAELAMVRYKSNLFSYQYILEMVLKPLCRQINRAHRIYTCNEESEYLLLFAPQNTRLIQRTGQPRSSKMDTSWSVSFLVFHKAQGFLHHQPPHLYRTPVLWLTGGVAQSCVDQEMDTRGKFCF